MAKFCDVLSPMIYPSHFFGMDGIAHPWRRLLNISLVNRWLRFEKITQGSGVVIRPWLQAFRWRSKTYSPKYIEVQVITAKEKGGIGFLFWNAAKRLQQTLTWPCRRCVRPKGKYFRGDELSGHGAGQHCAPGKIEVRREVSSTPKLQFRHVCRKAHIRPPLQECLR